MTAAAAGFGEEQHAAHKTGDRTTLGPSAWTAAVRRRDYFRKTRQGYGGEEEAGNGPRDGFEADDSLHFESR